MVNELFDEKVYVLKITGKAFEPENVLVLSKYRNVLEKLVLDGYKFVIIAGGGFIARKYIDMARRLGIKEAFWLDEIGIRASRLNALLLSLLLQPYSYPYPLEEISEVIDKIRINRIVVMGGLVPGQSTATTAVEIAEAIGSKTILNAGAVDYVYTKDPAKHPDAKPLHTVKASELLKILETRMLPGEYQLLDQHAVDIMIRSSIKMILFHYQKPEKIIQAIKGENPGTIIVPE